MFSSIDHELLRRYILRTEICISQGLHHRKPKRLLICLYLPEGEKTQRLKQTIWEIPTLDIDMDSWTTCPIRGDSTSRNLHTLTKKSAHKHVGVTYLEAHARHAIINSDEQSIAYLHAVLLKVMPWSELSQTTVYSWDNKITTINERKQSCPCLLQLFGTAVSCIHIN